MAGRKVAEKVSKISEDGEVVLDKKPDASNKRALAMAKKDKELITPIQRIAGSKICHRNWTVHQFKEVFPQNAYRWVVGEYYPYAAGGGMFFDFPKTETERRDCEVKRKTMKRLGWKYAVVVDDMDEHDIAQQLE